MFKRLEKSNKGFTLIELIVTILIMSIMAGAVTLFFNAARNSYGAVHEEVTMQTEADIAMNFIDDIAQGAVSYRYDENIAISDGAEIHEFTILTIEIYEPDPYYYFFVHAKDFKEMRFYKVKSGETNPAKLAWVEGATTGLISNIDINKTLKNNGIFNKANQRCFVAGYVTNFTANIPDDVNKKGLLCIKIDLEYGNSTFSSSKNIASRNVI